MENYPSALKDSDDLDNGKNGKLLAPSSTPVLASSSETLCDGLTPAALSSTPSTDTLTPKSMKVSPMSSPVSSSKNFVPSKSMVDGLLNQTASSSSSPITSPRKFVPINVGDSRFSRPSTPVKTGTPISSPVSSPRKSLPMKQVDFYTRPSTPVKATSSLHSLDSISSSVESPTKSFASKITSSPIKTPVFSASPRHMQSPRGSVARSPTSSPKLRRAPSPILGYSYSSPNMIVPSMKNICKYFSLFFFGYNLPDNSICQS